MSLLNQQRGILPNIYALKKLIPWFDAVSAFLDTFTTTNPTFKAAAFVNGNAYAQQYGFTAPITVVGPGIYECFFATPIDNTANYIAIVSLAGLSAGDAVLYDIGVAIVDTTRIRIRVYSQVAAPPAAPVATNHDFYASVERLPGV